MLPLAAATIARKVVAAARESRSSSDLTYQMLSSPTKLAHALSWPFCIGQGTALAPAAARSRTCYRREPAIRRWRSGREVLVPWPARSRMFDGVAKVRLPQSWCKDVFLVRVGDAKGLTQVGLALADQAAPLATRCPMSNVGRPAWLPKPYRTDLFLSR